MLREVKNKYYHYFVDKHYRVQGEYKKWWDNGQLHEHYFCVDGKMCGEYKDWYKNGQMKVHALYSFDKANGEYKEWSKDGILLSHCFYANNIGITFNEIPIPETEEDRMYFKLKYDIPLLPVETKC